MMLKQQVLTCGKSQDEGQERDLSLFNAFSFNDWPTLLQKQERNSPERGNFSKQVGDRGHVLFPERQTFILITLSYFEGHICILYWDAVTPTLSFAPTCYSLVSKGNMRSFIKNCDYSSTSGNTALGWCFYFLLELFVLRHFVSSFSPLWKVVFKDSSWRFELFGFGLDSR